MTSLRELREAIDGISICYDYELCYTELYNTMVDYWNETQDFFGEEAFEDIVDYELAEQIAEQELRRGGLIRLYYFMGNVCPYGRDLFRINAYGNLSELYITDLENLKAELLELIYDRLEDEENE